MKRLLAYLFIVLGLGLVVNNFAFAKCIKGNCTNGKGIWTEAGKKYVGKFKDGKYHGKGTLTYAHGSQYVGKFKDGKYHGKGTKTLSDGSKYVGGWKENKMHGQGTLSSPYGIFMKGIWKNGELIKSN